MALGLLRLLRRAELLAERASRPGRDLQPRERNQRQPELRLEHGGHARHHVLQPEPGLARHLPVRGGRQIIWSPVKDLDIGVEAFYTQIGVKNGCVIDVDKDPTAYSRVAQINAGGPVRTATQDSVSQMRFRVQRDF
ncbi:hypothetical protein GCM10007890_02110 [Methylobacterium tardum]|uniref:Porin n=1 Tax=Methylobacterium tardum TaxID=374432 RepID=A0AA37WPH6_9HYPH|nr:hypothetical protein GCM10007890_02110 [Methylobacterium tardum]